MTRPILRTAALLLAVTACGDRPDADAPAGDSAAAVAPEMPRNPHVMAIDVGLAVDSLGRVVGSSFESVPEPDTVYVAVRTQYVAAGAPLTVRMLQGERTVQSVEVAAGTPDPSGIGRATAMLTSAANAAPGDYRIEVLLDGVSQGIRELRINQPQ
jgi:hypothetical protein